MGQDRELYVGIVDLDGESILAAQMLDDQAELEKLESKAAENTLTRRQQLRKQLCKNGATMLERYSRLKGKLAGFDAHHVLQDAAMLGFKNYMSSAGISIPLAGRFPGSPHSLATAGQRKLRGSIPDAWVATEALHYAGCDQRDVDKIIKVIEREHDRLGIPLPF
jgi:hypothetical protein